MVPMLLRDVLYLKAVLGEDFFFFFFLEYYPSCRKQTETVIALKKRGRKKSLWKNVYLDLSSKPENK